MSIPPSTPIEVILAALPKSKDVTVSEGKGIEARTPPYDGVRTWGDLLVVRERIEKKRGAG